MFHMNRRSILGCVYSKVQIIILKDVIAGWNSEDTLVLLYCTAAPLHSPFCNLRTYFHKKRGGEGGA